MGITMDVGIILVIVLLLAVIGLLVWVAFKSGKPTNDAGLNMLQEQVSTLRQELSKSQLENEKYHTERLGALSNRLDDVNRLTLESINRQLNDVSTRLDTRLGEGAKLSQDSAKATHDRLDGAAKAVRDVSQKLAELSEANRQIYNMGQNLQELQDILRAPKLRGGFGESLLVDLLKDILPADRYKEQHTFKNGNIVDAIIQFEGGMLPIDAKFPLENFRKMLDAPDEEQEKLRKAFMKDVKKHVDVIAKKYILPDEGTLDFAFMYIPAEGVYYETLMRQAPNEDPLSVYASSKNVIPVSPNSLYAYLQLVLMGLRGLKIQKNARDILAALGRLHGDFERISDDFNVLGKHLGHASKSHAAVEKRLDRFGTTLENQRALADVDDE